MNKQCIAIKLTALLALAAHADIRAQESDKTAPRPSPPFLARAIIPSAWTIKITHPAQAAAIDVTAIAKLANVDVSEISVEALKPILVEQITVTRAMNFVREDRKFDNGKKETSYLIGAARVSKTAETPDLFRSREVQFPGSFSPDYSKQDFAGFEWLSGDSYRGIKVIGNRRCYHFSIKKALKEPTSGQTGEPIFMEAFIDEKTRLPVQLITNGQIRSYSFHAPAPDALNFPADIRNEFESWRAEIISLTTPAPPP